MSKSSLYVPKNTSTSSLVSIVRKILSEEGGGGISLNDNNTWIGVQSFNEPIEVSGFKNVGDINLPTTTGTIALITDIPTDYVSTTTDQSIFGLKVFEDIVDFNGGIQGPLAISGNVNSTTGNFLSSAVSASGASCNYQLVAANTGIRASVANEVRITTGGTDKIIVTTGSIQHTLQNRFVSGTAAVPGISWASDTGNNSGWYLIANDQIGTSINGVNVKTLSSTSETSSIQCNMPTLGLTNSGFTSAVSGTLTANRTLTIPDVSGTIALTSQIPSTANFVDLTSTQSISGTKTFTQISASSLVGCEFYSNPIGGGGSMSFDTTAASTFDGVLKLPSLAAVATYTFPSATCNILGDNTGFTIGTGSITLSNGNFLCQTVSPGITSCNYQLVTANTGLRASVANEVRVTTGGNDRIIITTGSVQHLLQNRFASGTVSAPGITWTSETGNNSGWYLIGNDNVGGSINGIQTHQWDSSGYKSTIFRCLAGTNILCGPSANSAAGTCSLQLTPSTDGWSTGGVAQISLGDSNHYVKSTNGTGLEISSVNAIKLGSNGTGFLNMQHAAVAYSTPLGNNGSVNVPITFASAFSSAPTKVLCSIVQTIGSNWDLCISQANSVTTTGFNFVIRAVGGATTGACNLVYIAIQ